MTTRKFLAALALLCLAFAGPAHAEYPARVIKLVVPFSPGGVTDTSGRFIAEGLSKRLGQRVIVENKPGASGNPGTASVAQAEPDGYTLVLAFDGTMVINPHVFPNIPFDTLKDFAPVGKIGDATLILVAHPSFPGNSVKDMIEISKKEAQGLSYGTSGVGGTPHIAGELLNARTGAKLVHIPYKGGGQAMADALGGNVPLVYTAVAGAITHVQAGKLKAIAVSSGKRSPSMPDTPTFVESGVSDFVVNSWVGILAPAKTPRPVIDKLNKELNALLSSPETSERLAKLGIVATPGTPEQFGEQMKNDLAKYAPVVKGAGIRAQ